MRHPVQNYNHELSKFFEFGFGFSSFEVLLSIKLFCWKQLGNIILYVKTMV